MCRVCCGRYSVYGRRSYMFEGFKYWLYFFGECGVGVVKEKWNGFWRC